MRVDFELGLNSIIKYLAIQLYILVQIDGGLHQHDLNRKLSNAQIKSSFRVSLTQQSYTVALSFDWCINGAVYGNELVIRIFVNPPYRSR